MTLPEVNGGGAGWLQGPDRSMGASTGGDTPEPAKPAVGDSRPPETAPPKASPRADTTPDPTPSAIDVGDDPGTGYVHLVSGGPAAGFASLRGAYPIKLLAPKPPPSQPAHVALLYTLAYGGGLVAGDKVQLACDVDSGLVLVLRTQGSTKVYRHRPGLRPRAAGISRALADAIASGGAAPATRQRMLVRLAPGSALLLLPDALSPFRASRYVQAQRVVMPPDGSASVLLLDWLNSGRGDRPPPRPPVRPWHERASSPSPERRTGWEKSEEEYWAMHHYASTNELVVGDRVVARERMVLDSPWNGDGLSPAARKLAPYHVYATVLIYGPLFTPLRAHLDAVVDAISQFQIPKPPGLLWSYSPLEDACGILRVAGLETEDVRAWLRIAFEAGGVADIVGPGLWPRCI